MMAPPLAIPAPVFVETEPAAILREIIADFEALTGRPLRPAQAERLLVDFAAYFRATLQLRLQDVGEQALLATARYPMLDWIGDGYGVTRLPEAPARTTVRLTLASARGVITTIPAGARVQSADGRVVFATQAEAVIAAGALTADILAIATTAGVIGNGYLPGAVGVILDPQPYVATVINVTTSTGGADRESDEAYRLRIQQSHAAPSTAGSVAGYRAHAQAASPAVIDVAVSSPAPGHVRVAVLTAQGTPSGELLALVEQALADERVRPITDQVAVVAPTRVEYAITATVTRFAGTDGLTVLAAARAAAEAYAAERRAVLGRDVIPSQLVARLSVAGTYAVTLASPSALVLGADEWADCTAITIVDGGTIRD